MKKTIELPQYTIDVFTPQVISGETIEMYHLYRNGIYVMAFASKTDLFNHLNTMIGTQLGVY